MKFSIRLDIFILFIVGFFYHNLCYSDIEVYDKSLSTQKRTSQIFPYNYTNLQKPLYQKLVFIIVDGLTYDIADKRINKIPLTAPECGIYLNQIKIHNELLNKNPESVVFQKMQIEPPALTQNKISTFLKGIDPSVLTLRVFKQDSNQIKINDSILYQIGQSKYKKSYGYLSPHIYNHAGYHLNYNYFAINPEKKTFEQQQYSKIQKIKEFMQLIKENNYETLFIQYELFNQVTDLEEQNQKDILEALQSYDELVTEITEQLDDETILIIVSNHEKNEGGDNLRCGVQNSLFFAYSKNGFIQEDSFIKRLRRVEDDKRISKQAGQFQSHEVMVASTISNLLSIPIPFINSGRTLFEIYPANQFKNRLEMLQRVLQDSFTTLEQQKHLLDILSTKINVLSLLYLDISDILNQIEEIEINLSLTHISRDDIIYNEDEIEIMITRIVKLQNLIEKSINEIQVVPKILLIIGIIFGSLVSLITVVFSYIHFALRCSNQIKTFIFIALSTGFSFFIFFVNHEHLMKFYGLFLFISLIIFIGIKKLNQVHDILRIIVILLLNSAIVMSKYKNVISETLIFSDSIIFILQANNIIEKNDFSKKKINSIIIISIIFAIFNALLRFNNKIQFCLLLNFIYYIYTLKVESLYDYQKFINQKFKIDILILNILSYIIHFCATNTFLIKHSLIYSIVLVNTDIFSKLVSRNLYLFYSFYSQTHLLVLSAILLQLLNIQTKYFASDFSSFVIVLYYLPIPFILINSHQQNQQDDLNQFEILKENQDIEIQNITPYNKILLLKNGIILLAAVSVLLCSIGQLQVIQDKKIYSTEDTNIIFSQDYFFSFIIPILITNIFLY